MRFLLKIILTTVACTTALSSVKYLRIHEDKLLDQIASLNTVKLTQSDIIFRRQGFPILSPVVIEKYKLVFFPVAKVASTEWVRMLVRMESRSDWCSSWIHRPHVNKLKRLFDYPIADAQEMMSSPDWTKAVFVRNPHERVLSAFLDKAVKNSKRFIEGPCQNYANNGGDIAACIQNHKGFDFFLRNITVVVPGNEHWSPIYDHIDAKWWPQMNFIGYFENLRDDAENLLKLIHSNDRVSAWDQWGKTGWSDNERNCTGLGDQPFLGMKDKQHGTGARAKLINYYTPDLDAFVNEKYANDLNNPHFKFSTTDLFLD